MSRKLTATTLALTIAGGVYLTAGSAHASNMGFKLERSFPVVRENPADNTTSFTNLYLLSFPLFNGLGDVADGNHGPPSNCVGDAGGPTMGDGVVNTVDVICDLFTDRATNGNSFAVARFNRDFCLVETQSASKGLFGLNFSPVAYPLDREAGLMITVGATVVPPPQNRAVIVGSHDPSYAGRQVRQPVPDCTPRLDVINLPYHTMYTRANEILCGLEGLDWVDTAPADGNPDTCDRAIFDGVHAISVGTFDNVNDDAGPGDNSIRYRIVTVILGQVRFQGPNFDLAPGEAYILSINPGQVTKTFITPHF